MPLLTSKRFDPFDVLPPRARRPVGRHHQPAFGSVTEIPPVARNSPGALACVRSITPEPIVSFGRKRSTFIFLSAKTGTTQEGEGPWEYELAREFETNPLVSDYQMHGAQLKFDGAADGAPGRRYRPDAVYWSFETGVTMAEVKATESWFGLPDVRGLADRAREALARVGITFAEVSGDALRADRRRAYNVARAFADRTTAVSDRQRGAVLSLLAGGEAPFGRVAETLRVPAPGSLQALNSLMVRGHVSYDLSCRIDEDMEVVGAPARPADMPDIRRIEA